MLQMPFCVGLIKLKMHFLKTSNESEWPMQQSNLFHSIIAEGKKELKKKVMFNKKRGNAA